MNLQSNDISSWFNTLKDIEPEYTPIKVWNVLQFFRMRGKTSLLMSENLEPIPDLKYVVCSPKENRFYLKESRLWNLNRLYFFRRDLDFSGEDTAVEQLRRYVYDGNIHLLFTPDMIKDMKAMLARVYNGYFKDKGVLSYKIYIDLLENSLKLEDYKEYGSNLTGFKTVCNQYENTIKNLWLSAYKK